MLKQSACLERFLGLCTHTGPEILLCGAQNPPHLDCRSPGDGLFPAETMKGKLRSGFRIAVDAGKGLRVPQEDVQISRDKRLHCEPKVLVGTSTQDTEHISTKVMCVSFGTNDVTHLLECYIPHGVLQHTAAYRLPMESQRT